MATDTPYYVNQDAQDAQHISDSGEIVVWVYRKSDAKNIAFTGSRHPLAMDYAENFCERMRDIRVKSDGTMYDSTLPTRKSIDEWL
jgi:hypothetical protein